VDNDLGDSKNEGLFINGLAISGSSRRGASKDYFQKDQAFLPFDITNMVTTGQNWLYVNLVDHTGASGVPFSASIETVAVPLPASAWLGLGLLGVLGLARRLKPRRTA